MGIALMGASGALIAGGTTLWSAKEDDGQVNAEEWERVGVMTAIGGVSGTLAAGTTAGLAAIAPGFRGGISSALGSATASGSPAVVTQTLGLVQSGSGALLGHVGRNAIGGAVGGAVNNGLTYVADNGRVDEGMLAPALTGAATGAIGGGLAAGAGRAIDDALSSTMTPVLSNGMRNVAHQEVVYLASNAAANHGTGAVVGFANGYLTSSFDIEEGLAGAVNGGLNGASPIGATSRGR